MHVRGLHVFRLPEGAHADHVQTLYQRLLDCTDLSPMYRRKPAWPGRWPARCGGLTTMTSTSSITCGSIRSLVDELLSERRRSPSSS